MQKSLFSVLFIICIGSAYGQLTRDQAINLVITEIACDSSYQYAYIFSRYEGMEGQDTLWLDSYFDYLIAPFEENWVFFIDPAPIVHWAHSAVYVFVCTETGNYEIFDHNWPPHPYLDDHEEFLDQWEWILSTELKDLTGPHPKINTFPNPASSHINLDINNLPIGDIVIHLRDLSRKEYCRLVLSNNQANIPVIYLDDIPSGIYILVIEVSGSERYLQKIVVSH